jgi:hypothetical protein
VASHILFSNRNAKRKLVKLSELEKAPCYFGITMVYHGVHQWTEVDKATPRFTGDNIGIDVNPKSCLCRLGGGGRGGAVGEVGWLRRTSGLYTSNYLLFIGCTLLTNLADS